MEDINKLEERIKFKIAVSKIDEEKNDIVINKRIKFINRKIGLAACACLILITGVVFAKDIENYVKSIFANSTEAIDEAVENGYVQKEESDYTYDKDIGIKVSSLFLDDRNLDIAFNFELQDKNIKSIQLNNITIINDNDKVVYRSEIEYAETYDELPMYKSANGLTEAIKLTDTTFTTSILLELREHEEFNKLFFKVTRLDLVYEDDTKETIEGKWNFEVDISEQMKESSTIIYTLAESNENIESCTGTLSPSGMIIEIKPSFTIDFQKFQEYWHEVNINNIDELYIEINGNRYSHNEWNLDGPDGSIVLYYDDIGIFSGDIDTIELISKIYNTSITLKKLNFNNYKID